MKGRLVLHPLRWAIGPSWIQKVNFLLDCHVAKTMAFAIILLFPQEAFLSGPVKIEHTSSHFFLRGYYGPNIRFTDCKSENRYHNSEHQRLQHELKPLADSLENALLQWASKGAVLAWASPETREIEWKDLSNGKEHIAQCYTYSPYALHVLQPIITLASQAPAPEYERKLLDQPFTFVMGVSTNVTCTIEVRSRLKAARMEQLRELVSIILSVVKPEGRIMRRVLNKDKERTPPTGAIPIVEEKTGVITITTNHVSASLLRGESPENRKLLHHLVAHLEAEIASVKDTDNSEFGDTFCFTVTRGGYQLEGVDNSPGFRLCSEHLVSIPAEIEFSFVLRTVESDWSLDEALEDRMVSVLRGQLPDLSLKRKLNLHQSKERSGWALTKNRSN
jgi:hypothetical protein